LKILWLDFKLDLHIFYSANVVSPNGISSTPRPASPRLYEHIESEDKATSISQEFDELLTLILIKFEESHRGTWIHS
jgi:hypothetical protein